MFALGNGWRLEPDVRYRSLSRDVTIADIDTDVDLSFMTVELGFSQRS